MTNGTHGERNQHVPVIAAIERRAHIHSDYAILASVIVAAEGATFQDVGISPPALRPVCLLADVPEKFATAAAQHWFGIRPTDGNR